jgi:transposase
MREYFLDILNDLDKLAGLKQLDKIHAAAGDDRGAAITEINKLLNGLVRVSEMFPMIPEAEQKRIIDHAVIAEEFPSLNASVVYKWLARYKDKFIQIPQEPEKPQEPPLTGEARKAQLDKWLASLKGTENMTVRPMDRKEIATEGKEWVSEIDRKAVSVGIKKTSEQEINEREQHIQYIRENYDPYTGKPKPNWISEDQWRQNLSRVPEAREVLHPDKQVPET